MFLEKKRFYAFAQILISISKYMVVYILIFKGYFMLCLHTWTIYHLY